MFLVKGVVSYGKEFNFRPYLLSYFLQTLYGMADLFIIGQFDGTAGTTAVSIGSQVMHMLTVMIVGLAMGVTVSIGQAVGANNKQKASKTIGNTVILFMLVSIVLTLVLVFLVNPIVSIMSTPQEAVAGTKRFVLLEFRVLLPIISLVPFSEDWVILKAQCILLQLHV